MLIAIDENTLRVGAEEAIRKKFYFCPVCSNQVILRNGRVVAAHFAHKVKNNCNHGKGETEDHKRSKYLIASTLQNLDVEAHIEWNIPNISRIADIGVISENNIGAIELQKSKMCLKDQIKKSEQYSQIGIRALWITLSDIANLRDTPLSIGQIIKRYRLLSFERFALDHARELYCFDPKNKLLYVFNATPSMTYIPVDAYWDKDAGCEVEVGGYSRRLKSHVDLTVTRIIEMKNMRVTGVTLPVKKFSNYKLKKRGILRIN